MIRRFARTLTYERNYPWATALILAILFICFVGHVGSEPIRTFAATLVFGAISSGFVGTSLSILIGLDTRFGRRIRKTDYLLRLRGYIGWALASGIFVVIMSITGMVLESDCEIRMLFVKFGWAFAIFFCLTCLYRLARVMLNVFSHNENV